MLLCVCACAHAGVTLGTGVTDRHHRNGLLSEWRVSKSGPYSFSASVLLTEPSPPVPSPKLSSQQTVGQEAFSGLVVQPSRLAQPFLPAPFPWCLVVSILRDAYTLLLGLLRGKVRWAWKLLLSLPTEAWLPLCMVQFLSSILACRDTPVNSCFACAGL